MLTISVYGVEKVFLELKQLPPTNLYFVDIRKLMENYQQEYVPQAGDITGPGTVVGGCSSVIEIEPVMIKDGK